MKICIIDDNSRDRKLVFNYIHSYFSEHRTDVPLFIREFENGEAFLTDFKQNSYDLIFIDYFMEQLSGLEISKLIRKQDKSVTLIFITSSRDYAVDGYKVKASGYLVKPFTYEVFAETLSLLDFEQMKERQYVEFANGNEVIQILLKEVIYCDITGHYTQIHTKNFGIRKVRMPFSKVVDTLSCYSNFLLCYRGCLVNMRQIVRIEHETFLMANEDRIPFRKKERTAILKSYSEFLFQKVRDNKS